MFNKGGINPTSGRLKASVSVSSPNWIGVIHNAGPWLIRVPRPAKCEPCSDIFVREADLCKVFRNTGKFIYRDGTSVSIDLASEKILGLLNESLNMVGAFPISTIPSRAVSFWNEYADFRTYNERLRAFEGVPMEALCVYDLRPGYGDVVYYPKYPRFSVGEIILTDYIPDDSLPGIEYGYARIDRITEEHVLLGAERMPVTTYTIRRSWKGISTEDWNQQSKITDSDVSGKKGISMRKVPSSVQAKVRHALFDPFYR